MKMDFSLGKINLDFKKELNLVGQIIKKDHFKRLENGKGVSGGQMKPLKPSTVRAKGNDKILVDSGKMRNLVIDKATRTNQTVMVHPGKKQRYKGTGVTMYDVGGFHQGGTSSYTITPKGAGTLAFMGSDGMVFTKKVNHPGLAKREWFGISKKAEADAIKMIELKIEREIRRA